MFSPKRPQVGQGRAAPVASGWVMQAAALEKW